MLQCKPTSLAWSSIVKMQQNQSGTAYLWGRLFGRKTFSVNIDCTEWKTTTKQG